MGLERMWGMGSRTDVGQGVSNGCGAWGLERMWGLGSRTDVGHGCIWRLRTQMSVHISTHLFMHMSLHMSMHMSLNMSMHTCLCTCLCTYLCTHASARRCTHVSTPVYAHMSLHLSMHTCLCVFLGTCLHTCICARLYTCPHFGVNVCTHDRIHILCACLSTSPRTCLTMYIYMHMFVHISIRRCVSVVTLPILRHISRCSKLSARLGTTQDWNLSVFVLGGNG